MQKWFLKLQFGTLSLLIAFIIITIQGLAHGSTMRLKVIVDEIDWQEVSSLSHDNPAKINSYAVGEIFIPQSGPNARCT
ncbi:MAG: hypothetical protein ACOCUH_02625, partial [Bacteriovoracia bacterium]